MVQIEINWKYRKTREYNEFFQMVIFMHSIVHIGPMAIEGT